MLVTLSIRNLAVVEEVDVHFYPGFHVLTGETGAGKSIVIDALGLIAGGRGSADLIRYGSEKAEIEALFDLPAAHPVWDTLGRLGIEADPAEHLLIRRELTSQGKSTSRINGQMVNLSMLREVGEKLINIHGQHEHQSLLRPEQHMTLLDTYGEAVIGPAKRKYQALFAEFSKVEKELKELQETSQKAYQMLDMYRFQLEEIAAAKLKVGEDELLQEERLKLSHSEKMMDAVAGSYDLLYGPQGLETISRAITRLQDVVSYDEKGLKPVVEQLQSAYYQLEDAVFQLRDYRDDIEFNPERLDEIEHRLDMITGLRRKYGDNVEQILEYYGRIQQETELLENKDEVLQGLEKRRDELLIVLLQAARELSTARRESARKLARAVERELKDLQMERTSFDVRLELVQDANGYEYEGQRIRLTRQEWITLSF